MLKVIGISKNVGEFALKEVTFDVASGGYFVLLGVSGAGKTMLLKIIAGLRKPDCGRIWVDGQEVTDLRANKRGIGMVFQDNAIFPHLNVEKNIAYSLVGRGYSKSEIRTKVLKLAETMNIENLLDRKTTRLSGGELRRVALARTLAMEPRVLLLDEPLSSLDVLIQYDMMRLLKRLNSSGQTIIHVTHDYYEAFALADTLAIINSGMLEQTGTPTEVFKKPASRFVAAMTGIRNFFSCIEAVYANGFTRINIRDGVHLFSSERCAPGDSLFIREEDVRFIKEGEESENNVFEAIITDVIPSPDYISVVVNAGTAFFMRVTNEDMRNLNIRTGNKVRIRIPPDAVRVISKQSPT
jgi:ABC-type sugar transport system ATPase subunit